MKKAYEHLFKYDDTFLLQEIQLLESNDYPDFPVQKGGKDCNYVVHDPRTKTIYFYSRTEGAEFCENK